MPSPRTIVSRRLRTSMSGTELRIWIRLRGRHLDGWKFRRQQPIGPYYVDFYCPAARLVIEIDRLSHEEEQAAYDIRRQAWLEAEGNRVVRFHVRDVDENVVNVMDTIRVELEEREQLGFKRRPSRLSPAPPSPDGDTSP